MAEDILDAVAKGEGPEGLNPASLYLNQKQMQDFTARVTEASIGVHENPENPKNGQPYFRLEMVVEDVNGEAWGSERVGAKQYVDVELRPGDKISTVVELAKAGIKESAQKANFRRMTEIAATFSDHRASDFYAGRDPGPLGIREVFGDGTKQVGKLVHVYADSRNDAGYTNPKTELIPEASGKMSKKAS